MTEIEFCCKMHCNNLYKSETSLFLAVLFFPLKSMANDNAFDLENTF